MEGRENVGMRQLAAAAAELSFLRAEVAAFKGKGQPREPKKWSRATSPMGDAALGRTRCDRATSPIGGRRSD